MDPIIWTDTENITQQQMQYSDRYWHKATSAINKYSAPFHWGFTKLKTNIEHRNENILTIKNFEVILPNGRIHEYNNKKQSNPLEKDIKNTSGIIYLNIYNPHHINGIENYPKPSASSPHNSYNVKCADQHDPNRTNSIKLTEYGYSLTSAKNKNCEFNIPLCKIKNTGNKPEVDLNFIPPCICITTHLATVQSLETITEAIANNYTLKINRSTQQSIALSYMLHLIKEKLSMFTTYKLGHPLKLYEILTQTACLLNLKQKNHLKYNHENIEASLTPLIENITMSLTKGNENTALEKIEHKTIDGGVICTEKQIESIKNKKVQIKLYGARNGSSENDIKKLIKIDTKQKIYHTITSSLPGAYFEITQTKNTAEGSQYTITINVANQSELYSNPSDQLCLYLPAEIKLISIATQEIHNEKKQP